MVQIINDPYSGNAFGRIGKGLGQALSEQVPKEVERLRLASGLKKLEQEKDLDPFQFFTRAATLPGMNPQLIESLGRLSKQRMQGKALGSMGTGDAKSRSEAFFGAEGGKETPRGSETPSITTKEPIQETLKPYIPMSPQQIDAVAKDLFDKNPARFNSDPAEAVAYAQQIDAQNLARNQALQGQRKNENEVQSNVTQALSTQNELLGNKLPPDVYSRIENLAIDDVKNGRKTEQQAAKDYGAELQKISKEYATVEGIGRANMLNTNKARMKQNLRNAQKDFKARDDLENLAETYRSKNGLSPGKAYYLAYPVSDNKQLNNIIAKLPKLSNPEASPKGFEKSRQATQNIVGKLAEIMVNDKNASPLAIAEELKSRGYDSDVWFNYLTKNRDKLGLKERQGRELKIPINNIPPLEDTFLFFWSGLDDLMEQE